MQFYLVVLYSAERSEARQWIVARQVSCYNPLSCFNPVTRDKVAKKKIERETAGREREREISSCKNKEYKKAKSFIWMFLKKQSRQKISNQKMKLKERDKSILEYVQCMYNNVHAYKRERKI